MNNYTSKPELTLPCFTYGRALSCYSGAFAVGVDFLDDALKLLGSYCYLGIQNYEGKIRIRHSSNTTLERLKQLGIQSHYTNTVHAEEFIDTLNQANVAGKPVIVCADATKLPWSVNYGEKNYRPHWFTVLPYNRQMVILVDAFEALTENGEQKPYQQFVSLKQLTGLVQLNRKRKNIHRWRDWGQGINPTPMDNSAQPSFELIVLSLSRPSSFEPSNFYEHWLALPCPIGNVKKGISGEIAFEQLAKTINSVMDIDDLTDLAEEGWVAARQRKLMLHYVRRLSENNTKLLDWCMRFEQHIVVPWHDIPSLIRVGIGRIQRGRAPGEKIVDILMAIKSAEGSSLQDLDIFLTN